MEEHSLLPSLPRVSTRGYSCSDSNDRGLRFLDSSNKT